MNDKKGWSIVKDSCAHKPDGLLVLNAGSVHSQSRTSCIAKKTDNFIEM